MNEQRINAVIAAELSKRTDFDFIIHDACDPVYLTYALKQEVDDAGGTGDFRMARRALFTKSLDSCRLFEERLTSHEWWAYAGYLGVICPNYGNHFHARSEVIELLKLTARQRCEAVLRVFEKWEAGEEP